jgi:hypothetical protein
VSGQLAFVQLPVMPDQGLPQAFTCQVASRSYDFGVYASLDFDESDPPETIYDLAVSVPSTTPSAPPGFLVLRVVGQAAAGSQVILLRKLVPEPGLVHFGGELAFKLLQARVARGNLNGSGHYGTQIVIGVAARWA